MYKGHDFLGIGNKNFRVEDAIKAISPGSIVGCFDSTWFSNFGDPEPKIRKLIASKKVSAIRVQLFWSYAHEGAKAMLVRSACARWEKLAVDTGVKVYLSPSCEYGPKTSRTLIKEWIKILRSKAPHCTPVLSPMTGASVIPGVLVEHHTDKRGVPEHELLSTDGDSAFDANAKKIIDESGDAVAVLFWGMRYNLAQGTEPPSEHNPSPPQNPIPPLRTANPDYNYIKSVDVLLYPPETNLTGLKGKELWKTHSEDKKQEEGKPDDPRANKPVLMIKEKVNQVFILDSAFKRIGSLGLYKDRNPVELQRYYSKWTGGSGHWAWQFGEMARENTGSDVIFAQAGKRRIRIGSAAFRVPFYQT